MQLGKEKFVAAVSKFMQMNKLTALLTSYYVSETRRDIAKEYVPHNKKEQAFACSIRSMVRMFIRDLIKFHRQTAIIFKIRTFVI